MLSLNLNPKFLSDSVVTTWEYQIPSKTINVDGRQYEAIKSYQESGAGCCKCYIVPPHLQQSIADLRLQDEDENIRNSAHTHGITDAAFRAHRATTIKHQDAVYFHIPHPFDQGEESITQIGQFDPKPFVQKILRSVYDAQHREKLPGKLIVAAQGDPTDKSTYKQWGSSRDASVNKALENALNVFRFYLLQYQYNSIDGKGMAINSSVHFGNQYENAFWNGTQMVYGDGSDLFKAFVYFLDVVGHELTHGVTGDRLEYAGESGALNEHFSDVMGYLTYMYINKLDASTAKWLLADGILQYAGKSYPLRSFKAPGTAYDIPDLGKDPQPYRYGDLYKGDEDDGGVHINSGIPNHAFYLFATALGGKPWEKAGLVWFTTMMTQDAFGPNATMADFANATIKTADILFKEDQKVHDAIRGAWKTVEVIL